MLNKLASVVFSFAVSQAALAAPKAASTIISDIEVTVANGGFNPDAFAYTIKASVFVGGNDCDARGVKASLRQSIEDGILNIVPEMRRPKRAPVACPRVWMPVYRTVTVTVRGFQSRIDDVVVHNIGEFGARTSVADLIDVTVTGVLTQVAAIGGETTGFALYLADGTLLEVDLATHDLDRLVLELDGAEVTVTGRYKTVAGVEIASRRVLEARTLEAQF